MVIDIEDSSSRSDPQLMRLRASLYEIFETALAKSAIPFNPEDREDRGDGILFLLSGAMPRTQLIDPMLRHVAAALGKHNQRNPLNRWLRVRIALHAGDVRRDAHGWGGREIVHTFRMVEAEVVKRYLTQAARAQCALVTSDHFYRCVVEHGGRNIDPTSFHAIEIDQAGTPRRAWIHIPGYDRPLDIEASGAGLPPARAGNPDWSAKNLFTDVVNIGRDFNS